MIATYPPKLHWHTHTSHTTKHIKNKTFKKHIQNDNKLKQNKTKQKEKEKLHIFKKTAHSYTLTHAK